MLVALLGLALGNPPTLDTPGLDRVCADTPEAAWDEAFGGEPEVVVTGGATNFSQVAPRHEGFTLTHRDLNTQDDDVELTVSFGSDGLWEQILVLTEADDFHVDVSTHIEGDLAVVTYTTRDGSFQVTERLERAREPVEASLTRTGDIDEGGVEIVYSQSSACSGGPICVLSGTIRMKRRCPTLPSGCR